MSRPQLFVFVATKFALVVSGDIYIVVDHSDSAELSHGRCGFVPSAVTGASAQMLDCTMVLCCGTKKLHFQVSYRYHIIEFVCTIP